MKLGLFAGRLWLKPDLLCPLQSALVIEGKELQQKISSLTEVPPKYRLFLSLSSFFFLHFKLYLWNSEMLSFILAFNTYKNRSVYCNLPS